MKQLAVLTFLMTTLEGVCGLAGNHGKQFYIGMFPSSGTMQDIRVDVVSKEAGRMTAEVPILNMNSQMMILAGVTTVHFNVSLAKSSAKPFIENRGIQITTTVPVALFVTLVGSYMETYLALPVPALGTSYKIASYLPSSYLIVAAYDNTTIYIEDRVNGNLTVNLNKMDTYQFVDAQDLSDTSVTGNEKFMLIAGSSCASTYGSRCNFMIEQMIPSKYWSKHFIVPSLYSYSGYIIKPFSMKDTFFCFTNSSNYFCKSIQAVRVNPLTFGTSPVVVTSDLSISLVQYGMGESSYQYPYVQKSPFVMTVPGVEGYRNEYYFTVPTVYSDYESYLCIVVPTEKETGLRLDGREITSKQSKSNVPSPFSNYTSFTLSISKGFHELNHTDKKVSFGAFVFGYKSNAGSFGFPAGFGSGEDECSSSTCDNGGTCIENATGLNCICVPGYTGAQCGEEIDECSSNPCQNSGICDDRLNSFTCACVNGFSGKMCQRETDPCGVCLNGGICRETENSSTCYCLDGFSGRHCEIKPEAVPCGVCLNGGICRETENSSACYCLDGISGRHCEIKPDTISSAPQTGSNNIAVIVSAIGAALTLTFALMAVIAYAINRRKKKGQEHVVQYQSRNNTSGITNKLYNGTNGRQPRHDKNRKLPETPHDAPSRE